MIPKQRRVNFPAKIDWRRLRGAPNRQICVSYSRRRTASFPYATSSRHPQSQLIPSTIFTRGFKYHETGWWEDKEQRSPVETQDDFDHREVKTGLFQYVSDARKENIYRLHKLDPKIYSGQILAYLFNLSRRRIDAILRLKQDEVYRRRTGRLYTQEDDMVQESSDSVDLDDLYLPDRENGKETIEHLLRPPSWLPADKASLALQALLQQQKLDKANGSDLNPTVPRDCGFDQISTSLAAGEVTQNDVKDMRIVYLDAEAQEPRLEQLPQTEGAALVQRLVEKEVPYLDLDKVEERIGHNAKEAAADARGREENLEIDQSQPYANQPAGISGWRFLDKLRAEALSDPYLLYYHTFLGLERERLKLLQLHSEVCLDEQGQEWVSPYEKEAFQAALKQYQVRRQRAVELFAELLPAFETRMQLEDEKPSDAEDQSTEPPEGERELVKMIQATLGTQIVDMEDTTAAADELHESRNLTLSRRRCRVLDAGLCSIDKSEDHLRTYWDLLLGDAADCVKSENSIFQHVQWEALQHHRRLLRKGKGADLYSQIGDGKAHALLEEEVGSAIMKVDEDCVRRALGADDDSQTLGTVSLQGSSGNGIELPISSLPGKVEGQTASASAALYDYQRSALHKLVVSLDTVKRAENVQAYVHSLFATFAWPREGQVTVATLEQAAADLLLTDLSVSAYAKLVTPTRLAEQLQALYVSEGRSMTRIDLMRGLEALGTRLTEQLADFTATGEDPDAGTAETGNNVNAKDSFGNLEEADRDDAALSPEDDELRQQQGAVAKARERALSDALVAALEDAANRNIEKYLWLLFISHELDAVARLHARLMYTALSNIDSRGILDWQVTITLAKLCIEYAQAQGDARTAQPLDEAAALLGKAPYLIQGQMTKIAEKIQSEQWRFLSSFTSEVGSFLAQDAFSAKIKDLEGFKSLQRSMLQMLYDRELKSESIPEEYKHLLDDTAVGRVKDVLLPAVETFLGTRPRRRDLEALHGGDAPLIQRVRAAKALVDLLKQTPWYPQYAAKTEDSFVESVEEGLNDMILEIGEDYETLTDPDLVELKPPQHFHIPSLRFRAFQDDEVMQNKTMRDGFKTEESPRPAVRPWRPRHAIRDLRLESALQNPEGQRRWSLAFKDTSVPRAGGVGPGRGATVIRDRVDCRLRSAAAEEETRRSWIQKYQGILALKPLNRPKAKIKQRP